MSGWPGHYPQWPGYHHAYTEQHGYGQTPLAPEAAAWHGDGPYAQPQAWQAGVYAQHQSVVGGWIAPPAPLGPAWPAPPLPPGSAHPPAPAGPPLEQQQQQQFLPPLPASELESAPPPPLPSEQPALSPPSAQQQQQEQVAEALPPLPPEPPPLPVATAAHQPPPESWSSHPQQPQQHLYAAAPLYAAQTAAPAVHLACQYPGYMAPPTHYASSWGMPPPYTQAPLQPHYAAHSAAAYAPPPQPPAAAPAPRPLGAAPAEAAAPAAPPRRQDILELLSGPGRSSRPRRLAIVLRGLPGSGKSRVARFIKEREVAAGGPAPRILSIDDYFMTEVERDVEDEEGGGGKAGRKRKVEVLEYQYDASMEEAYERDLLRALGRTLGEGRHALVVVDSPCITALRFKELWAAGQSAGYEVMAAELPDVDPEVCHRRNVHGRSKEDLWRMAEAWEPTPPYYASLDLRRLLAGAGTSAGGSAGGEIREVDMEGEGEEGGGAAVTTAAVAEDAGGSARLAAASRWAALEEEDAAAAAARAKRVRPAGAAWPAGRGASSSSGAVAATAAAVDDWRDLLGKQAAVGAGPSPRPRSIIGGQRASGGGAKRVRWPDEAADEAAGGGFRIGGLSQQLENVYVLQGLGPPPQDGAPGGAAAGHPASFADAARAERQAEASLDFRKILLGRGGAA